MKLNTAIIILAGISAEAFTSPYADKTSHTAFLSYHHDDVCTRSCLYAETMSRSAVSRGLGNVSAPTTSQESSQADVGGPARTSNNPSNLPRFDPLSASESFRERSVRQMVADSAAVRCGGPVDVNPLSASENFRERPVRQMVAGSAAMRRGAPIDVNPYSASESFRERPVGQMVADSFAVRSGGLRDINAYSASESFRERPVGQMVAGSFAVRNGGPVNETSLSSFESFRERSVSDSVASSAINDANVRSNVHRASAYDISLSATEGFRERPMRDQLCGYGKPLGQW